MSRSASMATSSLATAPPSQPMSGTRPAPKKLQLKYTAPLHEMVNTTNVIVHQSGGSQNSLTPGKVRILHAQLFRARRVSLL